MKNWKKSSETPSKPLKKALNPLKQHIRKTDVEFHVRWTHSTHRTFLHFRGNRLEFNQQLQALNRLRVHAAVDGAARGGERELAVTKCNPITTTITLVSNQTSRYKIPVPCENNNNILSQQTPVQLSRDNIQTSHPTSRYNIQTSRYNNQQSTPMQLAVTTFKARSPDVCLRALEVLERLLQATGRALLLKSNNIQLLTVLKKN